MTTFEGTNPYRHSYVPKPGYVAQTTPEFGFVYVESITTYAKRIVNEKALRERRRPVSMSLERGKPAQMLYDDGSTDL